MDGFEKSAKTARTPPQAPFQTRTRAQSAAEVATATAAENATAKTVASIPPTPIQSLLLKI